METYRLNIPIAFETSDLEEENRLLPKLQLMKKLRELRVKSGYTQQQVSEILNCARSTYTYYEIGKSSPDLPTLVKLAKIFNVSVSELLEEEKAVLS